MKKIICLCLFTSCLFVQFSVTAQPVKKTQTIKPSTPSMAEMQKMLKTLPPEQQEMVKNAMNHSKKNGAIKEDPAADLARNTWMKEAEASENAIGTITRKNIGPAGGTISSANGKISLKIPPGALETNTLIGIEESKNTAPLACGNSFNLTPDGQTFAKPVELTIKYSPLDIDGAAPETLWLVTKGSDGIPIANKKISINKTAGTLTAPIRHFCEIGIGAFMKLSLIPEIKELGRGQTAKFELVNWKDEKEIQQSQQDVSHESAAEKQKREAAAKAEQELARKELKEYLEEIEKNHPGEEDLVPLIREAPATIERHKAMQNANAEIDESDLVPLTESANRFPEFTITGWKTDRMKLPAYNRGTFVVNSNQYAAEFTAPKIIPMTNREVTIWIEMIEKKSGAKFIIISRVFLLTKSFFSCSLDGKKFSGSENLDPGQAGELKEKMAKNPADIMIANAHFGVDDKPVLFLGLVNGTNTRQFGIIIYAPKKGDNIVYDGDGKEEGIMVAEYKNGFQAALTEVICRRTGNGSCDCKERKYSLTVHISELDIKMGGLVAGSFSGTVYGGVFKDKCTSTEPYTFSGNFSLTIMTQFTAEDIKNAFEKNSIRPFN